MEKYSSMLYVPLDIAARLWKLEFDVPCAGYFNEHGVLIVYNQSADGHFGLRNYNTMPGWGFSAPIWSQVVEWLDSKEVFIAINTSWFEGQDPRFDWAVLYKEGGLKRKCMSETFKPSGYLYRQKATEAAILKALEILESR